MSVVSNLFTSVIVFASIRLIPGDVIDLMLAQNDISSDNDRAAIEASLGLDQPIYSQYFIWVSELLQGDLGNSLWQNTPVTELLALTIPITFELGFLALIVALSVAIPIGKVDPEATIEADTVSRTISVTTTASQEDIQKALADDGYPTTLIEGTEAVQS